MKTLKQLLQINEDIEGFSDLAHGDTMKQLPRALYAVRMVCKSVPEKHAQQAEIALRAFEQLAASLQKDDSVKRAPFMDDADVQTVD